MGDNPTTEKPRYLTEVDLLKFIAIAGMVLIHVYENWVHLGESCPYPDTPLDIVLQFLGGPICAPLFMIACGIGVIYTRSNRPADYLHRGMILLITAYMLNIVRGAVMVAYLGGTDEDFTTELMNVDILHLAGLSFIFLGILRSLKCTKWHVLICAIIFFTISNMVGVLEIEGVEGYVVGLFLFTNSFDVCFPFFEWFIYIAVGVFLGSCLRGYNDHDKAYRTMFLAGLVVMLGVSIYQLATGHDLRDFYALYEDMYYRQNFFALTWILGIVSMCMSAAYFLIGRFGTPTFNKTTHFFGKNLNRIYIIQWVIIGNITMILIYCDYSFDTIMTVPLGLLVLAISSLLAPVYCKGVECLRNRMSQNTGSF